MDLSNKTASKKYDRVMPRVYNRLCYGPKSSFQVTRHEKASILVGAKPSVSNVSSNVFSELPVVLNDYIPELSPQKVSRRTSVVKPRKTITSLDPVLSPNRSFRKVEKICKQASNVIPRASATLLQLQQTQKGFETPLRHCLSSRSHTKLRELKDEIKAYNDKEKLLRLRCNLYKKCGVVFDDVGCVGADKAVQVENLDSDNHLEDMRSQQRDVGENAGTALSDQQVHSSKKIEMVDIIGDDLWNPEPALRPEDEIILRKLHDMLQSTSDDLKLLSGELSKFHEPPGIQIKSVPTPLDEEFNEKVHIEELVNAKFHGYKIIDKSCMPDAKVRNDNINGRKPPAEKPLKPKVTNNAVQVNSACPIKMKAISKNLGISRTKIIQINEKGQDNIATERLNNGKIIRKVPSVSYNEFSFNYVEPKVQENQRRKLQIQTMPCINIRSELTEQRVLDIDILPDSENRKALDTSRTNVMVVSVNREESIKQVPVKTKTDAIQHVLPESIKPQRKVSKMSTAETSESTEVSSDARLKNNAHSKLTTNSKEFLTTSTRLNRKKKPMKVKYSDKTPTHNLEEWRKKLNLVYGASTSRHVKTSHKFKNVRKKVPPKPLSPRTGLTNNAEYIPYSQLTLGGIKVSDIEKELSNIPFNSNEPLSNLFDEILSSREQSSKDRKSKGIPKILTTSDENLLEEVINLERTVSDTISKNITQKDIENSKNKISSNDNDENESYADDFEDVKSDSTVDSGNEVRVSDPRQNNYSKEGNVNDKETNSDNSVHINLHKTGNNTTFTKTPNLSIKDSVDIFEFIHSVDTQDIATQSNTSNKILPKETQTSPRNDKSNIQPIHNDLWPSIDPRGEIEKMLTLEREFIKKLIVDEYGDLLEKNIAKQSTSKDITDDSEKNIVASQKNTQTSPARVKSVMTSPKRTKTRTTSPFVQQLTATVAKQTSPIIVASDEEVNNEKQDITINLSSPRFSLRLPQNSREVISNLEDALSQTSSKKLFSKSTFKKFNSSSSSSVEAGSSSELSSLGEIRLPVRRRLKKSRVQSISESSSSSIISKCSSGVLSGGIIPLRSEGEVSIVQRAKKASYKSEGETSFGIVK